MQTRNFHKQHQLKYAMQCKLQNFKEIYFLLSKIQMQSFHKHLSLYNFSKYLNLFYSYCFLFAVED